MIFNYILQTHFKDFETKFVVLLVDGETILNRDKERREDCQIGERCLLLLQNFILDTSKFSVEESVKEIIKKERFLI